jgi:hypothetical protein
VLTKNADAVTNIETPEPCPGVAPQFKYCKHPGCARRFARKRRADGYWEPPFNWNRRSYCSMRCAQSHRQLGRTTTRQRKPPQGPKRLSEAEIAKLYKGTRYDQ